MKPNTLGKTSLTLGIISSITVFAVALITFIGARQGNFGGLRFALFICASIAAFLGGIGFLVGVGGLFNPEHNRSLPITGIGLNLLALAIFFIAVFAGGR